MESGRHRRQCSRGTLLRLLPPGQRLYAHLGRIALRRVSGNSLWASVGASLDLVGGVSWGVVGFPAPHHPPTAQPPTPARMYLFRFYALILTNRAGLGARAYRSYNGSREMVTNRGAKYNLATRQPVRD